MKSATLQPGQRSLGHLARLVLAAGLTIGLLGGGTAPAATAEEPPTWSRLQASIPHSPIPIYAERTITLKPVKVESVSHWRNFGDLFRPDKTGTSSTSSIVGWSQTEKGFGPTGVATVYETAVKFDMSELDAIDGEVTRAVLRFDETKDRWTSGSGAEQYKDGCVAHLGIATVDWANQSVTALFPNDRYSSAPDGAAKAWEVTRHVKQQLASPGNASLRHGFVLQGAMDLGNLEANDGTSCSSKLSNFRLTVTMDVEEAAPAAPQPAPQAPPPPPEPPKPDLSITRFSGPAELAIGETAEYEIAILNEGAPVKDQPLLQISRVTGVQLVEAAEASNNGITCQINALGIGCFGSLGGDDDRMASRVATIRVQVMGMSAGKLSLIASANHGRTFDEKTVDNNLKLLEVTVK
jgi:hypothetical protein